MQQNLISIIVPVYKVEKYLEKCVNSILEQSYHNLEIILVDDGSPDKCGKICDEYQKKDSRIKVIHKKNGGLSDARNAGIRMALGQYLGFVDSDDYIAPDMYEHLFSIMKERNADIGVCNACVVSENSLPEFTDDLQPVVFENNECLKAMICDKLFTVNTWNKLYKRHVFDEIEFPVGKLYEDLATTYKLIEKANKIVVSKARKYAYVQRDGSIMNQTAFKMKTDKIDIVEEMWIYFSKANRSFNTELQAGIIEYIINDIFKMIGSHNANKNPEYRERVRLFIKNNENAVFSNKYISNRKKAVLYMYLLCPAVLSCVYSIKRR